MARKSRKQQIDQHSQVEQGNEPAALEHPLLPSAAYIRLSNIDEDNESSIESQVMLVQNYIRKHPELKLKDTYIDNGYTGTNFDRPEFDRMMQDVRTGRIQCIVVKDLSRFGRDYLEMGYYLETIFPRLDVRFIAVTDDFDNTRSDDMESITVPIKNIVNNYYAKDISKKVISANEARRKRGDLIAYMPPYGYTIDKEKRTYVVDEDTACYARVIFQWFCMGVPKYKIVDRMNLIQAPRPSETKGKAKDRKEKEKDSAWGYTAISRILSNVVYFGDVAAGKTKAALYKGLKQTRTDPKDWIIQKNTHPALVPRADFDVVQKRIQDNREKHYKCMKPKSESNNASRNPFVGIIYCSCCGRRMQYARMKCPDKDHPYGSFFCPSKLTDSPCGHHSIRENLLKILVMDQIKILIQTACEKDQLAKSILDEKSDNPSLKSLNKKISALSGQIELAEKRKTNLYEDYAGGILDKEEYQYMKEHYIREKQNKEEQLRNLQQKAHELQKKAEECVKAAEGLKQYADDCAYNEKLVSGLVESIYVGINNSLNITFKCGDIFQEFMDTLEELGDEE